ncbi:MAG: DUF2284 domain-containing protein [Nitrospinae bacterium]|nr:DUF2284 domain-containing protein [Nitrospinota bacterium]
MSPKLLKLKNMPLEIRQHQEIIDEAHNLGCVKAKVIHTKNVELGNWVKLQCQYGCSYFGKRFTCPPHSPTVDEMSEILLDYQKALVVQAEDSQQIHELILKLEDSLRKKGFYKAFGIVALPCNLCEVCTIDTFCKYPEKARPTFQACGIDVPRIVNHLEWDNGKIITPCTESHNMGMILIH